ncbi:MAG: DnaJ domain-containing protein [Ahrensia sp.]|nr:DnaJ domain-containing protein [Ahrensia sp.]
MGTTIVLFLALLFVGLIIFAYTPAATLAAWLRAILPLLLVGFGIVAAILFKSVGLGAMFAFAGFALWRRMRSVGAIPSPGRGGGGPRRSSVRSAALEMELDHESGAMNGMVLVGRHEGRELEALTLEELYELRLEISDDGDSLGLLDAYLDRRFPAWREDRQGDVGAGQAGAARAGSMSEEEAYQVLGLTAGADAAEIRSAHRRLMKTAHPDSGGSTFLAAKINEAKDVLLKSHS